MVTAFSPEEEKNLVILFWHDLIIIFYLQNRFVITSHSYVTLKASLQHLQGTSNRERTDAHLQTQLFPIWLAKSEFNSNHF